MGFTNVDAAPHLLSVEATDVVLGPNKTTPERYYKDNWPPPKKKVIADTKADLTKLPFEDESAEEVIMLHVLEHFPLPKVRKVLKEIRRVLAGGGNFRLAVPDAIGNARLLLRAQDPKEEDWVLRLFDGTQANQYSHHYCSYTSRSLREVLKGAGFGEFEDRTNINFYPALHLDCKKA